VVQTQRRRAKPDPVTDAARKWLSDFVERYAGIDAGERWGDPVHAARVRAQEFPREGPKPSDPFTIAGIVIDALPADERAVRQSLASWLDEYLLALREADEG